MPRKLTPGMLGTGTGWSTSNRDYSLTGVVAPGPYIGEGDNPEAASSGWASHIQQVAGAHPASAITRGLYPDILISSSVQGALDELAGAVPLRPPMLGEHIEGYPLSGIPQWGSLGLCESDLITQGIVPSGNAAADVYPYYWKAVNPTSDEEFSVPSQDPVTDELMNWGMSILTLVGAGSGEAHAGGHTRSTREVLRTVRVLPRSTTPDPANPGFPVQQAVTLSGTIFPADRGVLALFHFPANSTLNPSMNTYMTDFLGQSLPTRVVAALLLGQGITGSACSEGIVPCGLAVCDGSLGGIFGLGTDESGHYDPFSYPSQAGGQYDLWEIHRGVDSLGSPLRPPWDDFDGDTVPGAQRPMITTVPAPGQVRLGTDPAAGIVPVNFGIPILGGTHQAYDAAAQAAMVTSLLDGGTSVKQVWSTVFPLFSGTLPTSFFGYRLPLLKKYTPDGLHWTPRGQDPYMTKETVRYLYPTRPFSGNNYYPVGGNPLSLAFAGYYGGEPVTGGAEWDPEGPLASLGEVSTHDYWPWQIARYRHTFVLPVLTATGVSQDTGSYMLAHFKTEHDFEKFARDGIGWWDTADGYDVYGAHSLWAPGGVTQNLEHDGNLVNLETALTAFAPAGPAPYYGYGANPYHALRSSLVLDPVGATAPSWTSATYDWTALAVAGVNEGVVRVSGVAYFTPLLVDLNTNSFRMTDMDIQAPNTIWQDTYGTSSRLLTGGSAAPALISSQDPLFVDFGHFCGRNLTASTVPNASIPVGAVPGTHLTPGWDMVGLRYVNVPYDYCGAFNETTGPRPGVDALTAGFNSTCGFLGDRRDPVFSTNVQVRSFIRRPLRANSGTYTTPGITLVPNPAGTILWHSTSFDKLVAPAGWTDSEERGYGNFTTGAGPTYPTYRALLGKFKDYEERFLDETYRYATAKTFLLGGAIPEYNSASAETAFHGPGLGTWVGGPIEFPVKAGVSAAPWQNASWTYLGMHASAVPVGEPELQVAGCPDRDPPLTDGAAGPVPMSGVLLYPAADYTPCYPNAGHVTGGQPNYSVGYSGVRYYLRAFDLNFAHYLHTTTPAGTSKVRQLEGSSTFTLRLDGIMLENFVYQAPGPGSLAALNSGFAIQVKVPGLTTWMDAGRADGAGPSKQDTLLDGAGCLILGPNTYDFVDPVTKLVGCYIQVNVGPMTTLFRNTGTKGGTYTDTTGATGETSANECPVLIRVGLQSYLFDLQHRNIGNNNFLGPVDVQYSSEDIRGLVGISVVHEAVDTLLPPV